MSGMSSTRRRVTSLFLAAVMAVSLVTPAVLAAEMGDGRDRAYVCGLEAHVHSDACYEDVVEWTCRDACASGVIHVHDEACRDEAGTLICYLPEVEAHVHSDECYEDVASGESGSGDTSVVDPDGDTVFDDGAGEDDATSSLGSDASAETPPAGGDEAVDSGDGSDDSSDGLDEGGLTWAEPEGEELDGEGTVLVDEDEPALERVLTCGVTETVGWAEHVHDESCRETRHVLTCELPEHEHDESCVVVLMSDADVDEFVAAVEVLCDELESGEYEGSPGDLERAVARFDEILAGFRNMTEEQAARVDAVMARLAPMREFDFGADVLAGGVVAEIQFRTVLVAGDAGAERHDFRVTALDEAGVETSFIDESGFETRAVMVSLTANGASRCRVRFSEPGTYRFRIADETPGWWHAGSWDAVVEVSDVGGTLVADATYYLTGDPSITSETGAEFRVVPETSFGWRASTVRAASEIMRTMTTEEKVGQLFLVHYPADGAGTAAQARDILSKYPIGGYLVFAAMFQNSTPDEVRAKTADAQAASRIPLLFSVDEEGGKVTRISQFPAFRSSKFEGMAVLMSRGVDVLAADTREKCALISSLGLNVNHAPDCDVATSPSAYIYERTFGGDGVANAEGAATVVSSMLGTGVGSTMKHFPGYGATSSNTHDGFAVNDLSMTAFRHNDLLPFLAGMWAGGRAVMVTHNTVNAIDDSAPVSTSPALYRMLRDEYNFDGVAMTDDLGMAAIKDMYGAGKEALAALEAGADVAMIQNGDASTGWSTLRDNWNNVMAAVESGELPMSRVEASCRRVLCWKIETGILDPDDFGAGPEPEDAEAAWTSADGLDATSGTLTEMLAMARSEGGEVRLNEDCVLAETFVVPRGVTARLSLDGHALTYEGAGDAVVVDGSFGLIDSGEVVETSDYVNSAPEAGFDAVARTLTTVKRLNPRADAARYLVAEADFSGLGSLTTSRAVESAIRVRAGGSVTILGGYVENHGGVAAVVVEGGATLSMLGGVVANSGTDASVGGGVAVSGEARLSGGYVAGNVARRGGGVSVVGDGVLTVSNVVVACNRAVDGGGIGAYRVASGLGGVSLGPVEILDNVASGDGGGLYVVGRNVDVLAPSAWLSMNEASRGGNLFAGSLSNVYARAGFGELIVSGGVAEEGGGMYLSTTGTELVRLSVFANEARVGGGVRASSSLTLGSEASVFENVAFEDGGGVCATEILTLSGAEVSDNSAGRDGGGVHSTYLLILMTATVTGNSCGGLGGGVFAGRAFYRDDAVTLYDGTVVSGNVRVDAEELALGELLGVGDAEAVGCCSACSCEHCSGEGSATETEGPDESGEVVEGGEESGEESDEVSGSEEEGEEEAGGVEIGGDEPVEVETARCSCHEGVVCCVECKCEVSDGEEPGPVKLDEPVDPFELTGDEIPSGRDWSNVYLDDGSLICVAETLYEGTTVGVTTSSYPDPERGLVRVAVPGNGLATMDGMARFFVADNENYRCMLREDVVVLGSLRFGTSEPGEAGSADLLVQYYGDVYVPDSNPVGDDSRKLLMFNTEGGVLPTNDAGPDATRVRNVYVGDDNRVAMHPVLMRIYADRRCNPGTGFETLPTVDEINRIATEDVGYRTTREIWVAAGHGLVDDVDEANWAVHPFREGMYLTLDPEDASPLAVLVGETAIVRFVSEPVTTTVDFDVNFYDYDISDGRVYGSPSLDRSDSYPTSAQAGLEASGRTLYARTGENGINDVLNYPAFGGSHLAFGNANVGTRHEAASAGGKLINRANPDVFGNCSFGLVTGMDADGNVVYRDGVVAPNLFNEGPAVGKTVVPGHRLRFTRVGDVHTLTAVTGTDLDDLDVFWSRWNWNQTRRLWSNNFWPMDASPAWGADGHDFVFGSEAAKEARRYVGVDETKDGTLPTADDYADHNAYFGMNFQLTFELSEDYVSPLAYYFYGDDDMWVFLDGKLVCDIGGVHGSVGEYVNLRDYLPVGSSGTHTLSFFYTERGASGSTCWMQFRLPHPLVVTTPEPPSEGLEFGAVRVEKRVSGVEGTDERFLMRVDLADPNGVVLTGSYRVVAGSDGVEVGEFDEDGSWVATETLRSGGYIKLGAGEFATATGLPVGTRVRVAEELSEAQAASWTAEAGGVAETVVEAVETDVVIHNVYYVRPAGGPILPATGGPGVLALYAVASWSVAAAAGFGLARIRRRARDEA